MTARPKGGLGRGLEALFAESRQELEKSPPSEIEIARIHPRADQPRRSFSSETLRELTQSIKAQGVLVPLLVTPDAKGYLLVAGERRLRAARAAGLFKVPCRVLEGVSEEKMLEISLVENLQRDDLNAIELAEGYHRLVEDLGLSQQEVAERVGKDRTTVTNTLRLLQLPLPVKRAVAEGELSAGHARALLALENDGERVALAHRIVHEGLTVRAVEGIVRRNRAAPPKKKRGAPPADPATRELARSLSERFGLEVEIRHHGPGGRITFRYRTLEEMDRLIALLKGPASGER